MMRRLMAVLLALALAVALSGALADAAPAFSLGGVYAWGMSEAEILAATGNVKMEKEPEQNLTYLEPDDYEFVFEGLSSEITFGLAEDRLALIELDFADRIASQAVTDALSALYGERTVVTDLTAFAELEAMSDPEEIELRDDDPQTYAAWTAEDGTQILMITDAEDDEARVIFYTLPKE